LISVLTDEITDIGSQNEELSSKKKTKKTNQEISTVACQIAGVTVTRKTFLPSWFQ
jgi:hypothetical protein